MQLIRTTLRLPPDLKKAAERAALDEDRTLQEVFHRALRHYVETRAHTRARKIVFKTHDLGVPLDNLTRDDFYPDPTWHAD
jgi:hypothetical protein